MGKKCSKSVSLRPQASTAAMMAVSSVKFVGSVISALALLVACMQLRADAATLNLINMSGVPVQISARTTPTGTIVANTIVPPSLNVSLVLGPSERLLPSFLTITNLFTNASMTTFVPVSNNTALFFNNASGAVNFGRIFATLGTLLGGSVFSLIRVLTRLL
ncbi:hypothetical protein KP509_01G127700 [Ceratopteris richardii]|uniref:Uncharacterized protein n=1 Tax=Ceratopteris richardii TaxID=49495 RepID=A0A8T2VHC8_CERRI|nr:hypothetical protein KP509_01G127700 [Ceratopteris richardii]